MAGPGAKQCYYELLGVARDADNDEIKKAYRKAALKQHPDKAALNNLTPEEATKIFQRLNEAYETLSDKQERAWYDQHREQILRGTNWKPAGDGKFSDPFEAEIQIWQYFSTDCFEGYADPSSKDAEKSFYKVFGDLFMRIDRLEKEAEGRSAGDRSTNWAPEFGGPETEWGGFSDSGLTTTTTGGRNKRRNKNDHDDSTTTVYGCGVFSFYEYWTSFVTKRACTYMDEHDLRHAPNRQIRRLMEAENEKLRKQARKEYSDNIQSLVTKVRRWDPRARQADEARRRLEEQRKARQDEERKKIEEKKKAERNIEELKRAREEELERLFEQQEEIERREAEWRRQQAGGLPSSSSSASAGSSPRDEPTPGEGGESDDERGPVRVKCELCSKTFKSRKQFESHCKSKKHLQMVAAIMGADEDEQEESSSSEPPEMVEDLDLEADADDVGDEELRGQQEGDTMRVEDVDAETEEAASASPPQRLRSVSNRTEENSDEDSDEEAFLTAFAKRAGANKNPKTAEKSAPSAGGAAAVGGNAENSEAGKKDEDDATKLPDDPEKEPSASQDGDDHDEEPPAASSAASPDSDSDGAEASPDADTDNKTVKKKRRRAPKKEDAGKDGVVPAETTPADAAAPSTWRCSVCGNVFGSKNKLFDHLKKNPSHMQRLVASGDARTKAQKGVAAEDPSTKKGRKKK